MLKNQMFYSAFLFFKYLYSGFQALLEYAELCGNNQLAVEEDWK